MSIHSLRRNRRFGLNEVSCGAGGLPLTNLVLRLESSFFDATSNGTSVSTWSDLSGHGNDFSFTNPFDAGAPVTTVAPIVDQTKLLNGHPTIKFTQAPNLCVLTSASRFLSGSASGLEALVIYQQSNWPPTGSQPHAGAAFQFTFRNYADANTHQTYTDSNFYENFGTTTRKSLGASGIALNGGFHKYNVSATSGTYKAYVDSTNFYTDSSFATFSVNGGGSYTSPYGLGGSVSNATTVYGLDGWIAALYVWEKVLTADERSLRDFYLTSKWGL